MYNHPQAERSTSGLLMLALPDHSPSSFPCLPRPPLTFPTHTHPLLAAPRDTSTGKHSGNPAPQLSDEKLLGRGKNLFHCFCSQILPEKQKQNQTPAGKALSGKVLKEGTELWASQDSQRGGAGRPVSPSHAPPHSCGCRRSALRDSLPKQLRRQSSAPHRAELGFITQQSWGFI